MHEWLVAITNGTVLVIDAMVLVIIAMGTIQAFVQGLRVMLLPMLGACFMAMLVPTLMRDAPIYDSLRELTLERERTRLKQAET